MPPFEFQANFRLSYKIGGGSTPLWSYKITKGMVFFLTVNHKFIQYTRTKI